MRTRDLLVGAAAATIAVVAVVFAVTGSTATHSQTSEPLPVHETETAADTTTGSPIAEPRRRPLPTKLPNPSPAPKPAIPVRADIGRGMGTIAFEVFDEATGRPIENFDWVVEVIGSPKQSGKSSGHRAGASVPLDMPFNLRIEAEGFDASGLRQLLQRSGQPRRTHTIRLAAKT